MHAYLRWINWSGKCLLFHLYPSIFHLLIFFVLPGFEPVSSCILPDDAKASDTWTNSLRPCVMTNSRQCVIGLATTSSLPPNINMTCGSCAHCYGCSSLVAEYWTREWQGTGSTLARSTASNLELVADLLCAQANSASYPQWDGK